MFLLINESKTVGNPFGMVLIGDNCYATKKLRCQTKSNLLSVDLDGFHIILEHIELVSII